MEPSISAFCETLATFCNHVELSSQAISDSINRRPIPLDSAASTFLRSLELRISAASSDLDRLECMALDTVSFEELIGHCNEIYKINHKYASVIEDRLNTLGYIPEVGTDDEVEDFYPVDVDGSKSLELSDLNMIVDITEENQLLEDSISLKNLGLSDAALATLAGEDDGIQNAASTLEKTSSDKCGDGKEKTAFQSFPNASDHSLGSEVLGVDCMISSAAKRAMIKLSRADYDQLPSFMKNLVAWENLQDAVSKINIHFEKNGGSAINQNDLEALSLGPKARTHLLMLLRMNLMVVENSGSSVVYRLRVE